MLKASPARPSVTELSDLGAIRVQGRDAVRFLQGQLSNDIEKLAPQRALLAGLHNPHGRVIALLRLAWLAADDILALLPRELAAVVVAKLSKFVLRAKVTITDDSANWRVAGLSGAMVSAQRGEPQPLALSIDTSYPRWWLVTAANQPLQWAEHAAVDREAWRRLDIAAGLPQVYGATSEAFVAQMLNLDRLDAIDFDKGCYTGQEIIARAHYRGQVKRRMQHFHSAAFEHLAAGDAGQLPDGRPFKVVEAVSGEHGGYDFLAVAPVAD